MGLPLVRLVVLARRLFFYQGTLQYRALEAQQEQEQGGGQANRNTSSSHQVTRDGVDMRHNMAAAKAAAKGLKGENAEEVKVVPVAQWAGLVPPGTMEHVEVKTGD